jgi:outer membrane lipoprotein LolB
MKRFTNALIYLCCFALLASCVKNQQVKPNGVVDMMDLSQFDSYQFNGKMSFSDGQEGGSGQVEWDLDQLQIKLVLKAPLSKKSWELIEFDEGAQLTMSDGDVLFGYSAQSLISKELGWEVPWDALKLWVIGKRSTHGKVHYTDDGMQFLDRGWAINYSQLKPYGNKFLPYRITARKGSYAIKILIKHWQW